MLTIGIDPGTKGSAYAIWYGGDIIEHIDFKGASDVDLLLWFLDKKLASEEVQVGLENVHAQPEDGVKQAFTFGGEVRRIKTILALAGLDYELIQPQKWMNYVGWGRVPHGKENYAKRKKVLLEIAKEMTCYEGLTLNNADGFLIAWYMQDTTKTPD